MGHLIVFSEIASLTMRTVYFDLGSLRHEKKEGEKEMEATQFFFSLPRLASEVRRSENADSSQSSGTILSFV